MKLLLSLFVIAALTVPLSSFTPAYGASAMDLDNTVYLDLKSGRVVIKMRPDLAPKSVAQIKSLVKKGFYDGLLFHRVIDGFMAQTGDPTGTGAGGSGSKVPAEFTSTPFVRGTCGMARNSDPNSNDSQFFIMLAPSPSLDNQYTVWGEVVSGMEFVDQIKKGPPEKNGKVDSPDKIVKMTMASDAK